MSAATAAGATPPGPHQGPPRDLAAYLNGHDPLPRIVAAEPAGGNTVTLYRRDASGALLTETAPLVPWLLVAAGDLDLLPDGEREVQQLAGAAPLNRLVLLPHRVAQARAVAALRAVEARYFSYTSPVSQYLTLTGRTLFHDMRFEELHRLQLDVETTSLQPSAPEAAVLLVAISDNRGVEEVLSAHDGGEAALLRRLTERVAELDPDVVEGHNLIDFDIPYLAKRCAAHRIPMAWGRERQPVWLQEREGRYKVGARILPSMRVHVHGRHVVDTFQQIQRYDSQGKLESYALKSVMESLELVRPDREFVDRTQINELWRTDPQRLARYCLDDVRDVRALAELITPTEFYQAQIVPRSYQDVATGGTGEKINAVMVRAYVAQRESLPQPEPPRAYPGGYSELRAAGVFRRVVKCDVESLYPAVMQRFGYKPASDRLDIFLPLLDELTKRRLQAKRRLRRGTTSQRAYWNGLSSSYKVLINCFTPGHQVLTPRGFSLVEDLQVGDLVYSLNPETGSTELKPVVRTWEYDYDGPVMAYRHANVDFEVTPNHRFILEDRRGRRSFREAWELPALNNYSLPPIDALAPAGTRQGDVCDLSVHAVDAVLGPDNRLRLHRKTQGAPREVSLDLMMQLIGWYVSEGSLSESVPRAFTTTNRGLTRSVQLHQRQVFNPLYHQEIAALVTALGLRCRADRYGVSFSNDILFRFLADQCGRGSAEKRLPPWVFELGRDYLEVLWCTLMKGDGDKMHPRYTTKSPQLAEDFCRLCYLLGRRVTLRFDGYYRVWVKRERRVSLCRRSNQFASRPYKGKVYCVTVADNHTLLAGRNYKLNWVGQSFYGYLGYQRALFNDFDAAEGVTTTGQKLIKDVLGALEAQGCEIIEVDTDGVYFVPPPAVESEAQELAFVDAIGRVLPEGINLTHDGRYAGMVSLKQKTYFLLTYDGRLLATGSSLRSRRDELYLRKFVQEAAVTLIEGSLQSVSQRYLAVAKDIQNGRLRVEEFVRRESITRKTHVSPGLRRLAAAAKGVPVGQQVLVYQRLDGTLALIAEYAGDEDRDYLLRRLHDMATRFATLCEGGVKGEAFERLFPLLTGTREAPTEHHVQLSLFG